ncbi:hypothetical protein SAMN05421753_11973 [Planctomicrobium piriforme]|uniref:Uncharacterized protein n=1 Tax=Planctomicrobium piriforme TaxID=1576369 RepID=A0A1I3QZ06_9PLAN|nr:hypothetical protein SAMN05421753_11973 [Planctomicrobium piriforme]
MTQVLPVNKMEPDANACRLIGVKQWQPCPVLYADQPLGVSPRFFTSGSQHLLSTGQPAHVRRLTVRAEALPLLPVTLP